MINSNSNKDHSSSKKSKKREIGRKLLFYPMSILTVLGGLYYLSDTEIKNISGGIFLITLGLGYIILDILISVKNRRV